MSLQMISKPSDICLSVGPSYPAPIPPPPRLPYCVYTNPKGISLQAQMRLEDDTPKLTRLVRSIRHVAACNVDLRVPYNKQDKRTLDSIKAEVLARTPVLRKEYIGGWPVDAYLKIALKVHRRPPNSHDAGVPPGAKRARNPSYVDRPRKGLRSEQRSLCHTGGPSDRGRARHCPPERPAHAFRLSARLAERKAGSRGGKRTTIPGRARRDLRDAAVGAVQKQVLRQAQRVPEGEVKPGGPVDHQHARLDIDGLHPASASPETTSTTATADHAHTTASISSSREATHLAPLLAEPAAPACGTGLFEMLRARFLPAPDAARIAALFASFGVSDVAYVRLFARMASRDAWLRELRERGLLSEMQMLVVRDALESEAGRI
ncbi:hypothetical protein OH77DRAFT_950483 [Trametes cingulata]|nr:hypothetical protein OH77DRAFT_950483 [Trametes cingulata]